jgi:hypothetical protein
VAPFLDTLLEVESPQNQKAFLSALGAFDMLAIDKHSKPWIALTAAEQMRCCRPHPPRSRARVPDGRVRQHRPAARQRSAITLAI